MLGDDPFGPYLEELVRGERIGGRPLEVRHYRRAEEVRGCHILFISRSEDGHLEQILAQVRGRGLLTVGDTDGFNRRGGIIRFTTEGGKIRLRISVEAAKAAGLTISSKLLAHATIVGMSQD